MSGDLFLRRCSGTTGRWEGQPFWLRRFALHSMCIAECHEAPLGAKKVYTTGRWEGAEAWFVSWLGRCVRVWLTLRLGAV